MKTKLVLVLTLAIGFLINSIEIKAEATGTAPDHNVISGRILDSSTGSPLEYASVAVYKSTDSTLVTGVISDFEGKFLFEKMDTGRYYLVITSIGFEKMKSPFSIETKNEKVDLSDIQVSPMVTQLNQVVVAGQKSRVEYKIDKRIINVDKDINAKGGTAVSVLENTPSVQTDPQGNITLRGSSDFIVLIDGKPSVTKGSDALKQIPASAIKQIEVITNPSAKYDAEGQSGIINVILKKEKMQGFSGNVNFAYGTTDKSNGNLLLNYRKNKFNYFTGIDYADNTYRSTLKIDNITMNGNNNQYIKERADQFNNNDNLTFKLGADYDMNEKNTVSVSGSLGRQGYDNGTNASYHFWDSLNTEGTYNTSRNYMDVTGDVISLNADYRHTFGENHTFSFTNFYSSWDGATDNLLKEQFTNTEYIPLGISSMLDISKDEFNYNYRMNMDYSRPLYKGTFECGVQYRLEDRYEDLTFKNYHTEDTSWTKNDTFSYKLDYVNSIYSGYITYSNTVWGIGYQIGLRSEYFMRSIDISNMTDPIDFNKFMFYPSVHLSKQFNDKHQMQVSYSRRINRPQPWLLNNTPGYVDPYNIFMGSPYLKPEYTDAYELNYRTIQGIFTVSIQTYYRNTTNSFTALRLMQDDGIMIHQLINAENQQSYGVELGIDVKVAKWWQVSTNTNVYNYTLSALVSDEEKSQRVNTWDARLVNSFNLKWGTSIQSVLYYRAPSVDAQGKFGGFYTTNLAISQPLLKGKATIGLSAQNLLNSIDFNYSVAGYNFDNNYHIIGEGPEFMVNFTYNFNNFQNRNRGRNDDTQFKGGGAF
jgi:outer membrane receptor protein involved in Fe transport